MKPVRMRFTGFIVLLALAGVAGWLALHDRAADPAGLQIERKTIAILPFSNLDPTATIISKIALADGLTTLLRSPELSVRPFWQSRAFADAGDPIRVAEELNTELVLAGRYRRDGDDLLIGLEVWSQHRRAHVSNPGANAVVWRELPADYAGVGFRTACLAEENGKSWIACHVVRNKTPPQPSIPRSSTGTPRCKPGAATTKPPCGCSKPPSTRTTAPGPPSISTRHGIRYATMPNFCASAQRPWPSRSKSKPDPRKRRRKLP